MFNFPSNNQSETQLQEITRYGEISKKVGANDNPDIYIGFEDENPVPPFKNKQKKEIYYDNRLEDNKYKEIRNYMRGMGFR